MTLAPPPSAQPPGKPVITVLEAGTSLSRVHGEHPADAFNPTPRPSIRSGGRFDSLDGSYAYTYLGRTPGAALAETLCRDLPLDGSAREVPRARTAGRRLSTVEVTRDLPVLVLHGAALTQVGATLELSARPTSTSRLVGGHGRSWRGCRRSPDSGTAPATTRTLSPTCWSTREMRPAGHAVLCALPGRTAST